MLSGPAALTQAPDQPARRVDQIWPRHRLIQPGLNILSCHPRLQEFAAQSGLLEQRSAAIVALDLAGRRDGMWHRGSSAQSLRRPNECLPRRSLLVIDQGTTQIARR